MSNNNSIRIFSMDPGRLNFAYSVCDHSIDVSNEVRTTVVKTGILEHSLSTNNGDNLLEDIRKFSNELFGIHRKYHTSKTPMWSWAAERYTTSGRMTGTTSEFSNLMMGSIGERLKPSSLFSFNVYTSAVWKNAFNRSNSVKIDTKYLKSYYKWCYREPHELDAVLIGHYHAAQVFKLRPFVLYQSEQERCKLCLDLENVSESKAINRREKRPYFN